MTATPTEDSAAATGEDLLQAAAAVAAERARANQLQAAVMSNRRVGIAVGLVMAQHGLVEADALEKLRQVSMHLNQKLVDLAEDIIAHRGLT